MAKYINSGKEEIQQLRSSLRQYVDYRDGVIPQGIILKRLQEKWLPTGSFVCRNQAEGCNPLSCNNRCSAAYWLSHSGVVASLMRGVAEFLGDDPALYQAAGEIHDLDYVKAPHDLGCKDVSTAHPIPVVRDLIEMRAPALLSLAVLEHSPHLNLEPSSPLSEALIACDDAATLGSMGYDPAGQAGLAPEIIQLISSVPLGTMSGKHRQGMERRMVRAFNSLTTRNYHFHIDGRSDEKQNM